MKVRVYFNFKLKKFSIQCHIKGKGWRLLRHSHKVYLSNVELKVYENGRQRVLKTKEKNVHAYVIGTLVPSPPINLGFKPITYNPYKFKSFILVENQTPVFGGESVVMEVNNGVPSVKLK